MIQRSRTRTFYPESDGQPIAESTVHRNLLADLISALSDWLDGRPDTYVSGNLFVYYVKGQPEHVVCPDVFVAFGNCKQPQENYRTWRDGPFPQVIIELTSARTRAEDEGRKREIYEQQGTLEYYIFDPHFDPRNLGAADERNLTAKPRATGELWCYRRPAPDVPFWPAEIVAPGAVLHSDLLDLGLVVRGRLLRLLDEATGRLLLAPFGDLLAPKLAETRARAAEERAQAEAQARQAAEARVRVLAEEVARLRAELEKRSER